MSAPDIRWKQRFDNFKKALVQLNEAEELSQQRALSRIENQGLIQAFEFTFELAWNTLGDFLMSKGAGFVRRKGHRARGIQPSAHHG